MSDAAATDSFRERWKRWTTGAGDPHKDNDQHEDEMTEPIAQYEGIDTAAADAPESNSGGADGAATSALADQLTAERDALKDRLARLQAEFDNARKREARERQDSRDNAVQATVEPFLGVMDNFALALKSQGDVAQLRAGVELILKQMDEALRSLNVQPVESVGAQFDPRVHEALAQTETAEHPDHQVLEEIRRGYKLRDKLVRPALVRIASNPQQVNE